MSERHEQGLERRGRQIDTLGEHGMKKIAEALRIGAPRIFSFGHTIDAKKQSHHRTSAIDRRAQTESMEHIEKPLPEIRALWVQLIVDSTTPQQVQACNARRHRQWIAGKRAGLIDRSDRRKQIHDFSTPAKGCQRQPAAQNFSKAGEIGANFENSLRSAKRDAKTGDA